jgi:hypothetical protein
MNSLSEEAFKEWLEAEGVVVPVHTGLTAERIPNAGQHITCYIQSSEHVVGPLYRNEMAITIATAPHAHEDVGEDFTNALEDHRGVASEVRALIDGYDTTDLESIFAGVTDDAFSGLFVRDEQSGVDDGKWITTINFMFGSRRGGASG